MPILRHNELIKVTSAFNRKAIIREYNYMIIHHRHNSIIYTLLAITEDVRNMGHIYLMILFKYKIDTFL